MRALRLCSHALSVLLLIATSSLLAQGPPPGKPEPKLPPLPATLGPTPPPPAPATVAPATPAEAASVRQATEARLGELGKASAQDKPAAKALREALEERRRLLGEWDRATRERAEVENPTRSPEQQTAEQRADLEKTKALIEQATGAPDGLLPEAFQPSAKPIEIRLAEMKESIDAAQTESKERSADLNKLRAEGDQSAKLAALRAERDKAHQECAAEATRRGEREAAVASAGSAEARDLARERLVNFEWACRVAAEKLADKEARIKQETRRGDLAAIQSQARLAHLQLGHRLIERMERNYATLAERQRSDLKLARVKEESKAAHSDDPLEKFRAKRSAELLELEAQVVAYEKINTTSNHVSIGEQTGLADAAERDFLELKKLLNDGNVSPLDVLRLKNDFRRIGPERAEIVRTDLATSEAEQTTYENALTDAEIDIVNDSRDDRYDREALLEKLPPGRRAEAATILRDLETRHRMLLNRCRVVLESLAHRSEATHAQIVRRLDILDQHFAFIRTHIFWVRDAEAVGPATLTHARAESVRAVKALGRLAGETCDRTLWSRPSVEFVMAVVGLVVLPWPLLLARQALDRLRLATPATPAVDA